MAVTDPGAIYNQNLADIALREGQELATIGEKEGYLRTNVGNSENLITQAEPGTYTAERERAAKGGIRNSGVNSERKATIASSFAGKRITNQAKLTQGEAEDKRAREGVGIKRIEGEHTAAEKRAADEEANIAANPVVPAAAPASVAAPGLNTPRITAAGVSIGVKPAPQVPIVKSVKKQPGSK